MLYTIFRCVCLFVGYTADATVAQLVEQLIRNQQAAGSSPASSSKNTAMQRCNFVMQIAVFFCILFVHTRKTAVETVIRFLPLSDCHLSMQTLFFVILFMKFTTFSCNYMTTVEKYARILS